MIRRQHTAAAVSAGRRGRSRIFGAGMTAARLMAAIAEESLRGRGLVGGELAGSGGLKPEAGAGVALRRLAESDLIAVVTATMEGITEANDAFLRLVGCNEAELTAGAVD
jgi:hypothetical protein